MSLDLRTLEEAESMVPMISVNEGVRLLRETYGLRKTRTTILHWIYNGELSGYRMPGNGRGVWMVDPEDLVTVARKHAVMTSLVKPDGTRHVIGMFPSELGYSQFDSSTPDVPKKGEPHG